jgi:phosphatidylglycerophosphate synthase
MKQGRVLAAENLGRYKTVSQMTAVGLILIYSILLNSSWARQWPSLTYQGIEAVIAVLMWTAVIMTVVSAVSFLKHNFRKHPA